MVEFVIAEDAETTQARIELFKEAWTDALSKEVNERLKGNTPKVSNTDVLGASEITKEQFRKMINIKPKGEIKMTNTQKTDLVNVPVFAQSVSDKLQGKIRLLPLAYAESFTGVQASKVDVPKEVYVGDAAAVAEGDALDYTKMSQTKDTVEFKNYAKGITLTDQAVKGGFGDPVGAAERQVLAAVAGGIEKDMVAALGTTKLEVKEALSANAVLKAIGVMGEGFEDAPAYLLVNPTDLEAIEKGS